MAFQIPIGISTRSLTTAGSPSRISLFPSRTRSSMSTTSETDGNMSCWWKRSCRQKGKSSPCVSRGPGLVRQRTAGDPGDMKIFWRFSKIRKTRNTRHGRSGFPRTLTRNILISTESTGVCLRESGRLLLPGRDGKRLYEQSRSSIRDDQEKLFPKPFIHNI
ncbi:MAG: hypothetical protein UBAL2_85240039 [Leptospirillum rubarum]|nr:MAG: hypothetical protein UBAL2_85240039 [Leptospirillum rubarum]